MLRDSSLHLFVGSALAFVGSVLAGTVVGLPAALAQSGLGQPAEPQTRFTGTLSVQDLALAAQPIVAGDATVTVNGLAQGASVRTAPAAVTAAAGTPAPSVTGSVDPGTGQTTPDPAAAGALGIPAPVLDAYKKAADQKNRLTPSCRIEWSLLAAVGKVESGHAAGGKVDGSGRTRGDIIGPPTRHGTAKGPMQFLDSSWRQFGADGNGDGVKDVHNIYDAALGAANHLCGSAGNQSLQDPANLRRGIFGYNRADWYVAKVVNWMNQYSGRATPVPPSAGVITPRPVAPAPAPVAPQPGGQAPEQAPAPGGRAPEPTPRPRPKETEPKVRPQTPPATSDPEATSPSDGGPSFGRLDRGLRPHSESPSTSTSTGSKPTEQ